MSFGQFNTEMRKYGNFYTHAVLLHTQLSDILVALWVGM